MAGQSLVQFIQRLRSVLLRNDAGEIPDRDLLKLYVEYKDEAAFEALMRRYGPMVWGVCRRILRHAHDAEDAFQATFLVLVRKASSLRSPDSLGNWLYGVAYRTALEARKVAIKQRQKEGQVAPRIEIPADQAPDWQPILDEELARLPDRYRTPLVLCDLHCQTRKEAARQLGWPEGTVASRLARGRALLAKRLSLRGVSMTAAVLAALLAQKAASGSFPERLLISIAKAAKTFATVHAAGGVISVKVAALTEGVLKTMLMAKLKIAMAVVLVVSVLPLAVGSLTGTTIFEDQNQAEKGAPKPAADKPQVKTKEAEESLPRVWKECLVIQPQHDEGDQVFCAAVSPDGKLVASGLASGTKLYDAGTGQERTKLTDECTWTVAFSPDGKILGTGHSTTVKLWDVANSKELAILEGHNKNCYSVAFSPDGKTLASASETIRLWDVANGKEIRQFKSPAPRANGVYSIAFSADGKTLASAEGSDKSVKLWNVSSGKELKSIKGHSEFAIDVAFSPDSKTVASGGGEEEIKLWDVATGRERLTLKGPTHGFHSLAYSPDGKVLASAGGSNNTVQLWEVATGKELIRLTEHTKQVWSAVFFRDGEKLVTAGDDAVRVWQAEKQPGRKK